MLKKKCPVIFLNYPRAGFTHGCVFGKILSVFFWPRATMLKIRDNWRWTEWRGMEREALKIMWGVRQREVK